MADGTQVAAVAAGHVVRLGRFVRALGCTVSAVAPELVRGSDTAAVARSLCTDTGAWLMASVVCRRSKVHCKADLTRCVQEYEHLEEQKGHFACFHGISKL